MELSQFENYVHEAIADIPERFRDRLDNVAFVVEDTVRPHVRTEAPIKRGRILLGLYQGVPYGHRSPRYSGTLPDKITLFQSSIERVAGPEPIQIRKLVRETVWHEVAHYFGMNEAEVRKWERHRQHHPG